MWFKYHPGKGASRMTRMRNWHFSCQCISVTFTRQIVAPRCTGLLELPSRVPNGTDLDLVQRTLLHTQQRICRVCREPRGSFELLHSVTHPRDSQHRHCLS